MTMSSSCCHRHRRWRARSARPAAALLAVLALAAGCTESSGENGQKGGGGASTSEVPTTEVGTKASGTPVKIGYTNAGTGATALPQIEEGARLAVERINAHEDGINGHPIELVVCSTDGTPESSASCANTLVSEGVVAVIEGADLGTDAKIPILSGAGIATVGTSTLGTTQSANPDAFFFSPPATTYPAIEVDLAAELGAKKVTLLLPDVPQVPIVNGIATKQAELNGIEAKVVKFDPAAPDFDAALAVISADGSDAIVTIATDDWCTGMVRSAKAIDYQGKLILGACSEYARVLGAKETAGNYGLASIWGPSTREDAPKEALEVIDQFVAAMDEAGKGDEIVGLTFGGYASIWQVANVLRTIPGELTAQTVMEGLRNLKDVPNALGQDITCNPRPYPGFSGCAEGWLEFESQADGTGKLVSDGFVKPKS
jgi:branched-chain amino acid transport system substrate-binding protein